VELDNDIFQFVPPANTPATPGQYGRALVRFQNDGAVNLYILFGAASTVTANSAAKSGNTQCPFIPPNQERDYEIDPKIDLWISARTANGVAGTTTLRYGIVSFPTQSSPGSG